MIQLAAVPPQKLAIGAEAIPPALPPPAAPDAQAAQLVAQLRLSLGQTPQLDQALGQLISLLA